MMAKIPAWLSTLALAMALPGAAAYAAQVRICVASDFDWATSPALTVPNRAAFADAGRFYGSLTQAGDDYREMRERANPAARDDETADGVFVTTAPVTLTKGQPCAVVPAEAERGGGSADDHHLWIGRGDDGTPVGAALKREQVRAMLIGDLTPADGR